MTTQLIILSLIIFTGPLMPPILIPLSYSLTGVLLIQNADPIILSILSVGSAVLSTTLIWTLQNYIIEKIEKINNQKDKNNLLYKITKYFKKTKKIEKISNKLREYTKTKHGKFAMFFIAIACYLPIIPDIITTRILYKKIKFLTFFIALIIGKIFTHIPFIFLGKGLVQLINGRFI